MRNWKNFWKSLWPGGFQLRAWPLLATKFWQYSCIAIRRVGRTLRVYKTMRQSWTPFVGWKNLESVRDAYVEKFLGLLYSFHSSNCSRSFGHFSALKSPPGAATTARYLVDFTIFSVSRSYFIKHAPLPFYHQLEHKSSGLWVTMIFFFSPLDVSLLGP